MVVTEILDERELDFLVSLFDSSVPTALQNKILDNKYVSPEEIEILNNILTDFISFRDDLLSFDSPVFYDLNELAESMIEKFNLLLIR